MSARKPRYRVVIDKWCHEHYAAEMRKGNVVIVSWDQVYTTKRAAKAAARRLLAAIKAGDVDETEIA